VDVVWSWLTTPPSTDSVFDAFGTVYFGVFLVGFVISAYLSGSAAETISRNPIQHAGIKHWAAVGLAAFGTGLFFFLVRALQINPLSFAAPLWMVGCTVALLATGVRCLAWWRTHYPAELAQWQASKS
jgi:hypothetical protein